MSHPRPPCRQMCHRAGEPGLVVSRGWPDARLAGGLHQQRCRGAAVQLTEMSRYSSALRRAPTPLYRGDWPALLLACTVLLNLVDAIATLVAVHFGSAVEANPLMAHLVQQTPILFMMAKLSLVSFGVVLLWRLRERRLARFATVVAMAAYAAVLLIHIQGWRDLAA